MVKIIPHIRHAAAVDHERLNSLINSMADGVIATDATAKIVLYNGAALNILDLNSSMEGKMLPRVVNLMDKNNQAVDVTQLILSAKTPQTSRDYRLVYPDKSMINLYLSIAPVRLGYGSGMQGYVLLLRDITREKSLEEERDEFISVVSHELRTPIAIAEGNLGNALFIAQKTANLDPGVLDALKQAHDQTTFLASMINDLATLSRAERGKLTVELESINVHDLLADLSKNYTPEAQNKGLQLHTEIDPSLELLSSSRLYVREILQNFITNAIKYTEKGSVTMGAKVKTGGIEFYVHDTGIGISKTDKEKVFDKFFRSEDFRTRQNSGTGLGLYVTMKLARLIHAEIEMESELNVGSTFKIFVPNLK
jgi:two-component system, OmpR family, phosphate regulon sensor histidine kinase PhoR